MQQASQFFLQQLKMVLSSLCGPYMLVCVPGHCRDMLLMRRWMGVLGYFLPDLEQGITELLDSLRCNLAASDEPKQCPRGVLVDIWQASVWTIQWYTFLHPPGTACSVFTTWNMFHHMKHAPGRTEDPLHQRRVWQWVQGFHPDTEWQSECHFLACRGLCVPSRICLPRPSLTHHQTGHAERCDRQHNVLHSFSTDLPILVFNGKCQSSSRVPGSEHRAH